MTGIQAALANQAMNFLVSEKTPTRLGNANPDIVRIKFLGFLMDILLSHSAMTGSSKRCVKRWGFPIYQIIQTLGQIRNVSKIAML